MTGRNVDLQAVMDEFWQNRAEAAEAENERLRAALRRFGYHDKGCEPSSRCTCGLIAALADKRRLDGA